MEEASGKDLNDFFDQWLYKPGTLKINATWQYDTKKKEVVLKVEQTQNDGSLFTMPVEIAIHTSADKSPVVQKIDLKGKSGSYSFPVDTEPTKVIIDPNMWTLMDATITQKK